LKRAIRLCLLSRANKWIHLSRAIRLSIPFKLLSISDTQKKYIKKERRKDIRKDREDQRKLKKKERKGNGKEEKVVLRGSN
jgi:hypothetical protein